MGERFRPAEVPERLALKDLLYLLVGFGGMLWSAQFSKDRPSVWNPLIDTASFAVALSLIWLYPTGSWARSVGLLIFGVHLGQVVQTNHGK